MYVHTWSRLNYIHVFSYVLLSIKIYFNEVILCMCVAFILFLHCTIPYLSLIFSLSHLRIKHRECRHLIYHLAKFIDDPTPGTCFTCTILRPHLNYSPFHQSFTTTNQHSRSQCVHIIINDIYYRLFHINRWDILPMFQGYYCFFFQYTRF